MNTPDIDYTKPPDDEPTVFVITNDLIRQLFASDDDGRDAD